MGFLNGVTTIPITYTNDNLVKHLIWVDIILQVIYSCISILININLWHVPSKMAKSGILWKIMFDWPKLIAIQM